MEKSQRDICLNPAMLADEIVLALAALERNEPIDTNIFKNGVLLCDYLIEIIEDQPSAKTERKPFHKIRDSKTLKETITNTEESLRKIKEIKAQFECLIRGKKELRADEIKNIQELFIRITMPIWRKRTSEFRERKLKRGLLIHG